MKTTRVLIVCHEQSVSILSAIDINTGNQQYPVEQYVNEKNQSVKIYKLNSIDMVRVSVIADKTKEFFDGTESITHLHDNRSKVHYTCETCGISDSDIRRYNIDMREGDAIFHPCTTLTRDHISAVDIVIKGFDGLILTGSSCPMDNHPESHIWNGQICIGKYALMPSLQFSFASPPDKRITSFRIVDANDDPIHVMIAREDVDCSNMCYNTYEFEFNIPEINKVYIILEHNDEEKEIGGNHMENNTTSQVVATFEIPGEIAKRLSELLVIQSIREKMLDQNIENPTKYEQMEKLLIPVTTEIDVLKSRITASYVPEQYRSDAYMWNFDGYEIDGCTVSIMKA